MEIRDTFPEVQRKRELVRMLDKITNPAERKPFEDELAKIEQIIREKNNQVIENAKLGIKPVEKISEENKMSEWPTDAKLVKQRVAIVEEELTTKVEEICKGDRKVIVSALGKVLKHFRDDKKAAKPAK